VSTAQRRCWIDRCLSDSKSNTEQFVNYLITLSTAQVTLRRAGWQSDYKRWLERRRRTLGLFCPEIFLERLKKNIDNQKSLLLVLDWDSKAGTSGTQDKRLQLGQDRSSAERFQKGLLFVLLICTAQWLISSPLHLWALRFRALNTHVMWLYRYSLYDFRV